MIKKHPTLGVEVSSDGQVRLPRKGWSFGHKSGRCGLYRSCWVEGHDYKVHRLVAETFLPNPENKPVIDHINRDPSDNHVENLRWATAEENARNTGGCDRVEREGRPHTWDYRDFVELYFKKNIGQVEFVYMANDQCHPYDVDELVGHFTSIGMRRI